MDSTTLRNAQRYAKENNIEIELIDETHVVFIKDSQSLHLTHDQVRKALHPEPPKGATHRGALWHYYKCDGRLWRVWREGQGWVYAKPRPQWLVCLKTGETFDVH